MEELISLIHDLSEVDVRAVQLNYMEHMTLFQHKCRACKELSWMMVLLL